MLDSLIFLRSYRLYLSIRSGRESVPRDRSAGVPLCACWGIGRTLSRSENPRGGRPRLAARFTSGLSELCDMRVCRRSLTGRAMAR
jgi:hypothetical protein